MTTKRTATDAFIARKAEIDAMIARLQAMSAEHFNADPEAINWGHVGSLCFCAEQLANAIAAVTPA
jgi:hypothetical protein